MTNDNYSKYLEWESFDFPVSLTNITTVNHLYRVPEKSIITIWRDHEFKLRSKLETTTDDLDAFEYNDPNRDLKDGHLIKGEIIKGTDEPKTKGYELHNCYVSNTSSELKNIHGTYVHQSTVLINLNRFLEINSEIKPSKINEWFLTGRTNLLFPRSTKRVKEETHTKYRDSVDKIDDNSEKIVLNKVHGSSRDYFLIDTQVVKCIVQLTPKSFLPDWANGFSIEYRQEFGIPDDTTKSAVSEIVGFVIGIQLLKIGSTEYDNQDHVLKKFANDPWGDNIIAKCDTSALAPVKFSISGDWLKIEQVINEILPNYIKLREPLNLSDILWKYWIARDLAIGTNLPILSSALESLAELYIKHVGLEVKYSESEKSNYKKLVEPEIAELEKKLKDFPLKDNVINKLRNPFQLGIGDKLRIFFKSLGFNFDNKSIENKALKSRNIMTHSTHGTKEEDIPDTIRLTRAYETLFNRTLLKILSYSGKYIDYFTYGHPERELHENIDLE